MNREVSLKTLLIIIVIAGLILGFFIYYITMSFNDNMSQLYPQVQKEHSYLNSI